MNCHHCGTPTGDSPFVLVLSGFDEDYELPLCRSCQSMRQSGQLPVDLLVQQWAFARSGEGAPAILEEVVIQLDCLGCGGGFRPAASAGHGTVDAQRMPDGSISTVCPACHRTNVLARRGGQLVATGLW